MPAPAPRSIVVIHGVGDHKQDVTATEFSRALGRAMSPKAGWTLPTLVSKQGDVQCETRDAHSLKAFTFAAYKISVPWPRPIREVFLYEFYWSQLSREGLGLLGEIKKIWRFLFGPARIGLQALMYPVGGSSSLLLGLMRLAYYLAASVAILRLFVSLGLIFAIGILKLDLRYYDILLFIDIVISALLVSFALLHGILLAATSFDRTLLRISFFGALALTATVLMSQALPLTIIEVTGFDVKAQQMSPWFTLGRGYAPGKGFPPSWFYSINTLPGFAVYLSYGLIVLWTLWVLGLRYAALTLRISFPSAPDIATAKLPNPERDTIKRRMQSVISSSKMFWAVMVLLVNLIAPLLFWIDLLNIQFSGQTIYPYNPLRGSPTDVLVEYLELLWIHFLSYGFIFLIWGILTWPWLRRAIAPTLELAFDVGGYFPPILSLRNHLGLRDAFRGRYQPTEPSDLERQLASRLQTIISYAHRESQGPVAVIGHGLGSVIALTALERWQKSMPGSSTRVAAGNAPSELEPNTSHCPPAIDLITMGNPLSLLATIFPQLYGRGRSSGSGWQLPRLRRWLNLNRCADPIGRELDRSVIQNNQDFPIDDVSPCNGGHSGYFSDDEVAAFLVGWLFTPTPNSGTCVDAATT